MIIGSGAHGRRPLLAALAFAALLAAAPAAAGVVEGSAQASAERIQARLEAMEAQVLALIEQDRTAEADALLATLLDLEIEAYGPRDWRVANTHGFRADLAESAGDMATGEGHRRREIDVLAQGDEAGRLAAAQISLALNLAVQGRQAEALPVLDAAAGEAERAAQPGDLRIRGVLARAHVLAGLDRQAEAEALLARADAAQAQAAPSALVARLAHDLAGARVTLGRQAEAEAPARRACVMADGLEQPDLQVVASACLMLASALDSLDRTAEAAPFARRAMEAHKALGADSVLRSGHVAEAAAVLIEAAPEAEREPFFRLRLAALAPGADEQPSLAWADAANSLGLWLTAHGQGVEAADLLRRSAAIYAAEDQGQPRNAAIVRANLADALLATGQTAEAEALALGLLPLLVDAPDLEGAQFALLRALGARPVERAQLLRAMAARRDARRAPAVERVDLYGQLANLAADRFDWLEALEWRGKAVTALREAGAEEPAMSLALAYQGRAMAETGDHAGAYAALSAAWSRLDGQEIPDPDRFYVAQRLADVARVTGRLEEADRLNRLALAGWRTQPDATRNVIGSLMGRSEILIARSDLGAAEAALAEALALARGVDDAGESASVVETAQAILWRMQGRHDLAEAALRRAVSHTATLYGPDALQNATPLKNLAVLLAETERAERALPLLEQALAIEARHLPPDSADLIGSQVRLAAVRARVGRGQAGADQLVDLADRAEQALGPGHPTSLQAREQAGWALTAQGRFHDAAGHFQRAVLAAEDVWGPDDYALMGPLQALAYAYYMDNRYDETLEVMRRTVEVGEKGGARWPGSLSLVKSNLGMTLIVMGRPREALAPLREAAALRRQGLLNVSSDARGLDSDRYPFRRLVQAAWRTGGAD